MNGSFEAIEGGHENIALQDLTGGVAYSINLGGQLSEEWSGPEGTRKLWSYLLARLDQGAHMGVSKRKGGAGRSDQIICFHAYGVLRLTEFNSENLVQVRNPWGQGKEWDGKFGDSDPIWGTMSDSGKEHLGYSREEDGTWWMPFEDFLSNFDEISICRMMVGFRRHAVLGEWKGESAGGIQEKHLCPQYHLHLEEDSHVVIELRQPSNRLSGKEYEAIAPVIAAHADRQNNVFLDPRMEGSVFMKARSSVVELDLTASEGPYSISPVAWSQGYESRYDLEVYTSGRSTLEPCKDDDLPKDVVTGELLKGDVLCFNKPDGTRAYVLKKNQEAYKLSTAPKCTHCNEPITGKFYNTDDGKIREECYDNYRLQKAPKCFLCSKPISDVGGLFSGTYYTIEDKGKLHEECHDEYRLSAAPKCFLCSKPISDVGGLFSGTYYTIEDKGKLHEECHDAFRNTA